jgi:hypothetical protein
MKALRHILLLVCVLFFASSCAITRIKDITLVSTGVKYVVPTSTRSMDAMLLLEVDNPSVNFNVSDVTGTLRHGERELAHFVSGQTAIQGKSHQVYELPCTVTLADGVSLLDVLVYASRRNALEGLKMDVNLRATLKNGLHKVLEYPNIDLSQFSR